MTIIERIIFVLAACTVLAIMLIGFAAFAIVAGIYIKIWWANFIKGRK